MSNDAPRPGDTVRFTTYGKAGSALGTLNGWEQMGTGYGLMAWIRLENGSITSRSASRVTAA